MKYISIVVLVALSGCTGHKMRYVLVIDNMLVVCKNENKHMYGVTLTDCMAPEHDLKIEDIHQVTNYIVVPDNN